MVFLALTCRLCGLHVFTEVLTQWLMQQSSDWLTPPPPIRVQVTYEVDFIQPLTLKLILLPWWTIKAIFCVLNQSVPNQLSSHRFFSFTSLVFADCFLLQRHAASVRYCEGGDRVARGERSADRDGPGLCYLQASPMTMWTHNSIFFFFGLFAETGFAFNNPGSVWWVSVWFKFPRTNQINKPGAAHLCRCPFESLHMTNPAVRSHLFTSRLAPSAPSVWNLKTKPSSDY